MYFAIFSLILLVSSTHGGPLPKLRHRPPKWARLEPIQIQQFVPRDAPQFARKFDSIVHFQEPDDEIKSIFGKHDAIYLTKPDGRHKKRHNLLDIVEQLLEDERPSHQKYPDDRDVMEVVSGLKRGLRRQGELPLKLVYEFNELVAK